MRDIDQGALVLVNFNYSNQEHVKLRPALVVSNSSNNRISRDVVVMKITSKEPQHWGLSITNNDLLTGSLAYDSYIRIDAIHSLEKSIIHAVIGTLNPKKMKAIKIQVSALLSLDTPVP
ncbi:MAG: type II toxin-antitoxin system PemK/MazF family toxin [Methanoregulaceae archaeon]|jgi:mRNA interferase MazF